LDRALHALRAGVVRRYTFGGALLVRSQRSIKALRVQQQQQQRQLGKKKANEAAKWQSRWLA